MIRIKNKTLHKKVLDLTNKYDKLELEAMKKGNFKKAKKYEKKSDNIYKKNYFKVFEVTHKGKKITSHKALDNIFR